MSLPMADWSPPTVPRAWLVTAVVLYAVVIAYGVLIAGQFLLTVFPGLLVVGLYLLWRFVVAVEAIADAQQRLANHHTGAGRHPEADDSDDEQ
jgi:predicted tellurium resistance membrane protein TerC